MYIEVIPLKYSLSRHPYTYVVPEIWQSQIVVGWLAEVPIGNAIDTGIIAKILDILPEGLAHTEIKPVITILSSTSVFSQIQIDLILELARRYCIPIHRIASLFFPSALRTRLDKRNYILESPSLHASWEPRTEIHFFSDSIVAPTGIHEYLLPDSIFIFPDDFFLLQFAKAILYRDDILMIPNDATDTKRAQAWIDIYEKKYPIIFWTRRLLYYNLQAYSRIIYVEDAYGSEFFQYPSKIRTIDILAFISKYTPQTYIITSSPTLELLHRFRGSAFHNIRSS